MARFSISMIRALNFASLLLMTGCSPDAAAPSDVSPPPSFVISDGAHSGGNLHFYFLPPMVRNPSFSGTFDGTRTPIVRIAEAGVQLVELNASIPAGSEQYQVEWHTDRYNLDPAKTYRITILVGNIVLGFADVDVVSTGGQLKNVNTGDYIPLLDGRTLPIKFRIEQGALTPANQPPTVDAGPDQAITLPANAALSATVTDDALPTGSVLTTAWSTVSGPGTVTFGSPNAVGSTASFSTPGAYVLRLTASDGELSTTGDVTVTVNQALGPDLVWRSCTATPADAAHNNQVDFALVLANDGTGPALFPSGYIYGVRLDDMGPAVGGAGFNTNGLSLAPGATEQVALSWVPTPGIFGTYAPSVMVDPDNRVLESNETNNTISCGEVVVAPPALVADLVITNVELTTSPITTATDFHIRITVANQGTSPAVINYPQLIVYSAQSFYVYPPNFATWTLAAGASQTFEVAPNWGAIAVGTHGWLFTVDPGHQVYESNETNNTFTLNVTVTAP